MTTITKNSNLTVENLQELVNAINTNKKESFESEHFNKCDFNNARILANSFEIMDYLPSASTTKEFFKTWKLQVKNATLDAETIAIIQSRSAAKMSQASIKKSLTAFVNMIEKAA